MNTKGSTNPAFDGLQQWPQTRVQHYRSAGLWGQSNLATWLETKLASRKNEIILSGLGFAGGAWQDLSAGELLHTANRLACGLQKLGLCQGERVVMQMGNTSSFVITLFALFKLGVIPVMALPGHRYREIEHFLQLTKARVWLASEDDSEFDFRELGNQLLKTVPTLEHVILDTENPGSHQSLAAVLSEASDTPLPGHEADPAGIALLLCSGGTTGVPKLIPRTHRDYLYNAAASAEVCGLGPEDRYLVCLPAAHNFPLACPGILGAIHAGAGIVVCSAPSPDIVFECIERTGATVTALVPALVRVWLEAATLLPNPPNHLRLLQVGGARLDCALAKRIDKELGCKLQQVFGMAEGLLNYTRLSDPDVVVQNTQGRPLSELDEIRVVDPSGIDVPPGKRGELWTRGPYTILGYYKDAKANQRSFTQHGYYRSGDLVRQLSSGHLVVEGRIREVIRRGAETVAVESLETLLASHASIQDVAVIGLPCERLGEQVCAAMVLTDPATAQPTLSEVRHFLTENGIARFMLPDSLEFIDQLPMTAVGKVARQPLATQIQKNREQPKSTDNKR